MGIPSVMNTTELADYAKTLKLETEWVWYGHHPCGSNTYSKAYVELGRFCTVFDFWQHYNAFPSIDAVYDGTVRINGSLIVAYSVFRSGVRPEWEDPVNSGGSEWGCRETLDRVTFRYLWETYVLDAIGENIPHCVGIRAINKTNRSRLLHKLEVWSDKIEANMVLETRNALQNLAISPLKFVLMPHQVKQTQAFEYQRQRRRRSSSVVSSVESDDADDSK